MRSACEVQTWEISGSPSGIDIGCAEPHLRRLVGGTQTSITSPYSNECAIVESYIHTIPAVDTTTILERFMKSLAFAVGVMVTVLFASSALSSDNNVENHPTEPELKDMHKAAEQTYKATKAAYDAGTIPSVEPVYTWSRRWMETEVQLAKSDKERRDARQAHFDRMKNLNDEVTAKYKVGAVGGEAEKQAATDYYFAEAKLWLKK
jgi:hypothetical protein